MQTKPKRRILLIDDDVSLLTTLGDFLRFEGYEVYTAESGEEGLQKLPEAAPDLIILDMSMPGMGGIGFLKAISRPDGKLTYPVLVLTARANMAEFFADVDVEGFIAKPCDPNDLLLEVGRILFLRRREPETPAQTEAPAKRRVLLGEDDPLVTQAVSQALHQHGFEVDTVTRGPDVVEKAILHRPDVVVVKRVLEHMNGDDVADLLSQMSQTRGIPVVLYDVDETRPEEGRPGWQGARWRRRVRSNDPATIVAAVRDVLAS